MYKVFACIFIKFHFLLPYEDCPIPYSFVKKDKKCLISCHQCEEPNQEYKSCWNACLEPSCHNPKLFTCSNVCEPGCFCKEGFIRYESGQCVPREFCQKCSDNEVAGYEYPMCEKTCNTKDDLCDTQFLKAECELTLNIVNGLILIFFLYFLTS